MAKNPNKKAKALQKDEQMNGAMKFFLAGCVAELYLLIIRRFYINAVPSFPESRGMTIISGCWRVSARACWRWVSLRR